MRVGFHGHNDAECGVANSLTAVAAGARHVQATMNGVGERTGNANLVSIIANLQLKMGHEVVAPERLERLTEVAHFVDELLNITPDPNQPYVGKNAFAHKGGLHVAGVRADATTFEHIVPEHVGNRRELLISELSGRGTAAEKAAAAGLTVDDEAAARIVERVKDLEHTGYHFEAADGSFELLMRREAGAYEPLFTLESWRVIVEKRADGKVETEATIKIWVQGERYVRTAEGNGPVNALDAALRDAISEIHPHLRDIELVNYKVRILDESHGTGRGNPRAHRRLRRAGDLGRDRGRRERHRRVVAGARRLARAARAARSQHPPALARGARSPRRVSVVGGDGSIGAAARVRPSPRRSRSPARCSAPRRRPRCSRCCAPGSCRSARASLPSRERSPAASPCLTPARCRAARPACTSRCGRSGSATATRS